MEIDLSILLIIEPDATSTSSRSFHDDVDAVRHHVAVGTVLAIGKLVGELVLAGRQRDHDFRLALVQMEMGVIVRNDLPLPTAP
jgi:hypothetical protein